MLKDNQFRNSLTTRQQNDNLAGGLIDDPYTYINGANDINIWIGNRQFQSWTHPVASYSIN